MRKFLLLLVPYTLAGSLPWIDLSGEWKIANGDNVLYARPDFDDSRWATITLPGINLLREPGYFWLRRTVRVEPDAVGRQLTLSLGTVSENYEVYVNGSLLARVGNFTQNDAKIARPRTFDVPPSSSPDLTIAVRAWLFARGLGLGGRDRTLVRMH